MEAESIRVTENDFREWSTTSGVVDYILYDAPNISMAFSIIEGPELSRCLSQSCVRS